jgi:hypothetical protein
LHLFRYDPTSAPSGRQSNLEVVFGVFSAPGDAKSDRIVPFGRGDAKSGVVPFGGGPTHPRTIPKNLRPAVAPPASRRPCSRRCRNRRGSSAGSCGPRRLPRPSRPLGAVTGVAARRPEAGSGGIGSATLEVGEEEGPLLLRHARRRGEPAVVRPGLILSSLRNTGSGRRWGRWAAPEVGGGDGRRRSWGRGRRW